MNYLVDDTHAVFADTVEVWDNGTLAFKRDKKTVRVFAPGSWSDAHPIELSPNDETQVLAMIIPVSINLHGIPEIITAIHDTVERGVERGMKNEGCYARLSTTYKTYTRDFELDGHTHNVPEGQFYLLVESVCLKIPTEKQAHSGTLIVGVNSKPIEQEFEQMRNLNATY